MHTHLEEDTSKSRRIQSFWLAYLGWIIAILALIALRMLNYSHISATQLGFIFAAATGALILAQIIVHLGLDRRLPIDPHFVYIPNWLFFAPITAYGCYAAGDARDLMVIGWLMGLLFLAGYARFRGVVLTACWYMSLNLGALFIAEIHGKAPVDMFRESIRSIIFLTVCVFFGFLFDRFAATKEHLKDSVRILREKDRVITLLNQKLSKFVTTPLVEQLAREESDTILAHQRRKITAFFSDIKDFSVITDALEPEELAQLLNEYFAEMIHVVFKFGGTLDKLMGDGMMVLFGAPESIEPRSGALRCVRMAVNMQERLTVLNEQWRSRGYPYPLKVRMGINTGLNIVGSFGSDAWSNYTAMGMQVNIAARLQQAAEPGHILLSHSTYTLVADQVTVKRLGEVSLKGSHYPIDIYQLEHLTDHETPLVLEWQGHGYQISLQPQILDTCEKEHLIETLEKNFGKPFGMEGLGHEPVE